jgi:hypothetical protein
MCVIDKANADEILAQCGNETELVAYFERDDLHVVWVLQFDVVCVRLQRKEFRRVDSESARWNGWGEYSVSRSEFEQV